MTTVPIIYQYGVKTIHDIHHAHSLRVGVHVPVRYERGTLYVNEELVTQNYPAPLRFNEVLRTICGGRIPTILDIKEEGMVGALVAQLGGLEMPLFRCTSLHAPDMREAERLGLRTLARHSCWEEVHSKEFHGLWWDYCMHHTELPLPTKGIALAPVVLVSPEIHATELTADFMDRALDCNLEGICTKDPTAWQKAWSVKNAADWERDSVRARQAQIGGR